MHEIEVVLPLSLQLAFAGALGAIVGSFLNVVIYRVPREGESLVWPGSRCTTCHAAIAWYDNIPILSWFILRGRCRRCSARFSFRYPAVEILGAVWFVAVYWRFGLTPITLVYFVFGASLIAVTFIDIDHRIIPNVISLPGILVGLIVMPLVLDDTVRALVSRLIGVLAGGGFLLATALLYFLLRKSEGMGLGDVKLLAMIGAFLGWPAIIFTVFLASLLGAAYGIVLMVFRGGGRRTAFAFGPALAVSALLYVFVGSAVMYLWLSRMFPPTDFRPWFPELTFL